MSNHFNVKSTNSIKEFAKKVSFASSSKVLFYVYSDNCHHCDVFHNTWKRLIANNSSDTVFVKVEIGAMSNLRDSNPKVFDILTKMFRNQSGVPNIAKYNVRSNRTTPFNADRTVSALNAFIK